MNKQQKIKYYESCIKAYKYRGAAPSTKQKIRWYENAIKMLEKQNENN